MRYALFDTDTCSASVAILIKERGFNSDQIRQHYIEPLKANPKSFVAFSLWYNEHNKCPAKEAKLYLTELCEELVALGIKTLLVADSTYFKYLCKESKPTAHHGYVLDSKLEGFEDKFKVILIPNYQSLSYDPRQQTNIDLGLKTLKDLVLGSYEVPGKDIIHAEYYPNNLSACSAWFIELLKYPELTLDIEARSLEFWNCGISTIAFAWDKHSFVSMGIERGVWVNKRKAMLKAFFIQFASQGGKLIGHNLGYDFKVLVYELWMEHLQDYEGMIQGIEVLTKCFDDTKLIAYLASNNAVKNTLDLKALSAPYTGNYAQEEITDTTKIPTQELLRYNGIDVLATWYVKEKYEPIMDEDSQREIYDTIFKPSVITLLQTELCGMPILPEKVQIAKAKLTKLTEGYMTVLEQSKIIQEFHLGQQELKCKEFTEKAKKKVFTMDDPKVKSYTFNPNSGPQLQALLYKYLGLPILDYTDTKLPATGGKVLAKLINHTDKPEVLDILNALIGLASATKILTSFIPAFENAQQLPDGSYRLYGNFNLGSVKSGRLSSSSPNLTNLPSHSTYAKPIKECFGCNSDWLFVGADSNSLEDMVSALTTRDKNKMKVYIDGFCGHCLRSYAYWPDKMPDIDPTDPISINSIAINYPIIRQDSKPVTFLKTYKGTYHGLMNNCGFSKEEAIRIETNFDNLYAESIAWVNKHLKQATIDGYVTGAFGLRLRTPILYKQNFNHLSYRAEKEGRTAGNMLGQSYCQLTMRAFNELRSRIWESEHRLDILPVATIHDSIYLMVRNKLNTLHWVNENLIDCMCWQELPELKHDIVKLGATTELYYPSWKTAIKIPNNAKKAHIRLICDRAVYGNHVNLWRLYNGS